MPLVQVLSRPASTEDDRIAAFVTIEAVNSWASFSRAFYVSCALGALRANGKRVAVGIAGLNTPTDALLLATKRLKGFKGHTVTRRDEPAWHKVNNLITLCGHLGASNLPEVVAAFGYATKAFDCLPTLRNFFAHRNQDTCQECTVMATSIPVPPFRRPADIAVHRDYAKPMNVLSGWIRDMTFVADQLVQ
jgi:hypothetical protein